MKDVMILTGAGQIGMAIARRMGYGMKIVIGDKRKRTGDCGNYEQCRVRCRGYGNGSVFP